MKELRWSPTARREITEIRRFFALHDHELAIKIIRTIQDRAQLLRSYLKAGEPFGTEGLRKLSVVTYPYIIVYEINSDSIDILRVHHAAQDWKVR